MSLPPIYDPGEFDEELFRPTEPLPDWKTGTDKVKQQAFLVWAVNALDELDRPGLRDQLLRMESDHTHQLLRERTDRPLFETLKREQLPHLTWKAFCRARYGAMPPKLSEKRGPKPNAKVAAAIEDWSQLTFLFRHYYKSRNRMTPPSRIDILKARYGLSEAECITVETECTRDK